MLDCSCNAVMTVKPSEKQLRYKDWELGVFFRFGIRTFHEGHEDWAGLEMDVKAFEPTELDCKQWVKKP